MPDVKGEREGVVTRVYDNNQRNLLTTITDIEHEYHAIIKASLHSHVTHNRCPEAILVHGDGSQILRLWRSAPDGTEKGRVSKTDNDHA
jgi:CopG family nickel-responsive transcriptional regulator